MGFTMFLFCFVFPGGGGGGGYLLGPYIEQGILYRSSIMGLYNEPTCL